MTDDVRPHPPTDALRAALAEHPEGLAAADALHASVAHASPDAATIAAHAATLRGIPRAEAIVVNWYESAPVQRFIANLTNAGL